MSNNQLWPAYTFQVNLPTLHQYHSSLPNRTWLDGNETVSEADNQIMCRSTWLTNLFPGCQMIAEKDGVQFTAYGMQAVYLRNLYCSNPPNPLKDILTLVSTGTSTPQMGGVVPSPKPEPMAQGQPTIRSPARVSTENPSSGIGPTATVISQGN